MKKTFLWLSLLILLTIFTLVLKPTPLYISGWIAYWDFDQSINTLNANKHILNEINPFIYSLDKQGNIICLISQDKINALKKIEIKKFIPTIVNDVIDTSSNKRILKDSGIIHEILSNKDLMNKHIDQIVELVKNNNYTGIDIDYEKINPKDYDMFLVFIRNLSTSLRENKKELSVTLEPKYILKNTGLNIKLIAKYSDKINIMCYNYPSNKTNQTTPLFWLNEIIQKAIKLIPLKKISLALSMLKENEDSIIEKIKLIKKYKIHKIAIWRIGTAAILKSFQKS
ncbi:MAG: glycosyl hydrolase family 18 protein [Candidatus Omnitrophota bacterium]